MALAAARQGSVAALLVFGALTSGCRAPHFEKTGPIQVAAAADLVFAFEELGGLFERRTGQKVSFSFGSSGALAHQLSQGAPFDLFAAASPTFIDRAIQSGACDAESRAQYARGRIVVWTRREAGSLNSLAELKGEHIKHVAIAHPEHAPYGRAAREALTRAGLWPTLESKVVLAENVRQALQFAETGNAEAAVVALSLVSRAKGGYVLQVDPTLYAPIEQTLTVCRNGSNLEGGQAFARLIESHEGQAVLQRHGFDTSHQKPTR